MTTEILLDAPTGHYRPKHIARSELAKIVTLRSTAITVGLTVVACLLVTGLVTHAALNHRPGFYQGFDPTQTVPDRHDHRRPGRRRLRGTAHHRRVLERHHPHHAGRRPEATAAARHQDRGHHRAHHGPSARS